MFGDNPLTYRIELRRAHPPHGLAFRPDFENVGGALRLGPASHRGTDNPDRRGATGILRVHHAGTVLKITAFGSVNEDGRRRYGAAAFARHVFVLKALPVARASECLHKPPEKGVTLHVQWGFRIAGHKAADMGAPAALLNPNATQFTQSAVMEHMLARTVVQDILLAGYLRGKQRRRINPCTVNGAVESDGTINRLQQFHVSAPELDHQPNPLALSKPV